MPRPTKKKSKPYIVVNRQGEKENAKRRIVAAPMSLLRR